MATPITPIKTHVGIWRIAMEIIKDEIKDLKSAWKKTSEQQLFHELETEYGFPRATCRSLVQLTLREIKFRDFALGELRNKIQHLFQPKSNLPHHHQHLRIQLSRASPPHAYHLIQTHQRLLFLYLTPDRASIANTIRKLSFVQMSFHHLYTLSWCSRSRKRIAPPSILNVRTKDLAI